MLKSLSGMKKKTATQKLQQSYQENEYSSLMKSFDLQTNHFKNKTLCKVFQKSVDGKLAKFNCIDIDSTKFPKLKIQWNFPS